MRTFFAKITLCAGLMATTGCYSMATPYVLGPGEHKVGLGVAALPLQSSGELDAAVTWTVAGTSGLAMPLDRPLALAYGVNLTGVFESIPGGYLGVDYQLWPGERRVRPSLSLSITERVHLYGSTQEAMADENSWSVVNQTDLLLSKQWSNLSVFAGLGNWLDLQSPTLVLAPLVGVFYEFDLVPGLGLGLDLRYFALNRQRSRALNVYPPVINGLPILNGTLTYKF